MNSDCSWRSAVYDAHVHMGYYDRWNVEHPVYYSPKRILDVLNRCGCDEFIVSSTCAQLPEIGVDDIVREAKEMKRISGRRGHAFFWLSGHLYDEDRELHWLNCGLFEGIKMHELETPWLRERKSALIDILKRAEKYGLNVLLHSGDCHGCSPFELYEIAEMFPQIHFDLAHCRPMDEMAKVIAECPNVWTDTAYLSRDDFARLVDYDWHGRLMFGTDLPVWQAHEPCGLTKRYREYVAAFERTGIDGEESFRSFIGRRVRCA